MDAIGPQGIDRHGGRDRGIDPAGKADDDPGKAVLVNVIAKAQDEGAVDRLDPFGGRELQPIGTGPGVVRPAVPFGDGQTLLERRQLGPEFAASVKDEGRAVEYKLVLATDLVQVDDRQTRLAHPPRGELVAKIDLVRLEWGTIDDDQDFGARLDQAFTDFGRPDIFAHGQPEPNAAKIDRTGQSAGFEDALFVEDRVVGQVDLGAQSPDLATVQQRRGIEEVMAQGLLRVPARFAPGHADDQAGPAVGGIGCERLQGRPGGVLEHRL